MTRTLFWISAATILYTYAGYPAGLWLAARLRTRRVAKGRITPTISVVVACHNEAAHIQARVGNLLKSDYPADKLELIIVSDGSTDGTANLARAVSGDRVRVVEYQERKGKAVALNLGVRTAAGQVIIFADARQRFEPQSIRELVANFVDPSVGAVSGELVLDQPAGSTVAEGVGLYWKYEKWIRKSEARLSSVIGATGAIYAIRRALWKPLPPGTILDDVYTPMRIALDGRRVVFDENARAHDRAESSATREFSRKVRTLTGNYQLCQLMPRLLLPTSGLSFQFFSHKLLRLAAPIAFVVLFASNLAIVASAAQTRGLPFYVSVLGFQMAFYLSVAAGGLLLKRNRRIRFLNFAYVFSVMNAAAVVGLLHFLLGKTDVWVRAK